MSETEHNITEEQSNQQSSNNDTDASLDISFIDEKEIMDSENVK